MPGSHVRKIITLAALVTLVGVLVPFSVSCSKPPRPTADFTISYVSGVRLIADPIAGLAPLTVRFTDRSTGDITSWRWNFGDGPAIEGSGPEHRNPEHTYTTINSGFIVVLTVKGPGGKHSTDKTEVTVFSCSEAANSELNQARLAIKDCLKAAGTTAVDSEVAGWDGSRGVVTAGGLDAHDYLGVWREFRAVYTVDMGGEITYGTDVSWGCIQWDLSLTGARWRAL